MHLMKEFAERLTQFWLDLVFALSPWGAQVDMRDHDRPLSDDEAAMFDAMLGLPPI